MTKKAEQIRVAFEAAVREWPDAGAVFDMTRKRNDGEYEFDKTRYAWLGYKMAYEAARATPALPDKAEVVERMAVAIHDLMAQGTSGNWDGLPEFRQSGFRNIAKAAYGVLSALPPQRDDSGLVEELVVALRMARETVALARVAYGSRWQEDLDRLNAVLAKHAAQAKARAV